MKFRFAKFCETGYKTIFVFRENEGRVSQFRKTDEITKETSFAKDENREKRRKLAIKIKI
jgi:hypothetical protein